MSVFWSSWCSNNWLFWFEDPSDHPTNPQCSTVQSVNQFIIFSIIKSMWANHLHNVVDVSFTYTSIFFVWCFNNCLFWLGVDGVHWPAMPVRRPLHQQVPTQSTTESTVHSIVQSTAKTTCASSNAPSCPPSSPLPSPPPSPSSSQCKLTTMREISHTPASMEENLI